MDAAAIAVNPSRVARARAPGSSTEPARVVVTPIAVRCSSPAAASAEPIPSPRRLGSTATTRVPRFGSATHHSRPAVHQPTISPPSSQASIRSSARSGTFSSEWRMPSAVRIMSGQARWRIAAALGMSSSVPSRITAAH